MASKVYFSKEITPEKVVELYHKLGKELPGNVAVKVHSGEKGNTNFIKPTFWKPMLDEVNGTFVENNTAYGDKFDGVRDHTEGHRALLEYHGWTKVQPVDLLDEEGPDVVLEIPNGKVLKENKIGKGTLKYDSMVVLGHFKGHPMGGYGGALKQLSIGCASSEGKALIHSGGVSPDILECWDKHAEQDHFCEAMADAASSVVKLFDGNMAFINVMKNLSVDCDCVSTPEPPCMNDIGILASLDPIALDQACMDKIYAATDDPGQAHFIERVESRHGIHTIEAAAELGFGSREYEMIEI